MLTTDKRISNFVDKMFF